jgi:hypothetical protein
MKRIEGKVFDKKALDLVKKGMSFAKIRGLVIIDNKDGTWNIIAFDTLKEAKEYSDNK